MTALWNPQEYGAWLQDMKTRIARAQVRVALAANQELLAFYWELGQDISTKLQQNAWGTKVIDQLSQDLRDEFPEMSGFSRSNLYYIKKFYEFFSIVPQLEGQLLNRLPWGHIKVILDKVKEPNEALFYVRICLESDWGRDTLALQIKGNLYSRQGSAITNFQKTLPLPQADLAQQTIKDPYTFGFMTLTKPYNERDIENQLVGHITKFLLELGKGFAFIGRQYHLEIAGNDYYLDLLFYHIKLRCYVVVELKNTAFIPEYAGKLNFYLSAVDTLLRNEGDQPTIGLLLCRDKNKIETEFALRGMSQPMGVSEFQFTEILPEQLKGSLPTVEEIEADFLTHSKVQP